MSNNTTLKDLVKGTYQPNEAEETIHRSKTHERPTEEVQLGSVSKESVKYAKTQKDPTPELEEYPTQLNGYHLPSTGYLIWCEWSQQMWYAPTKLCLDQNFIYRDDIEILDIEACESAQAWYLSKTINVEQGVCPSRKCYILDNPGVEQYEVYHESNYPSLKYCFSTTKGCFVHC